MLSRSIQKRWFFSYSLCSLSRAPRIRGKLQQQMMPRIAWRLLTTKYLRMNLSSLFMPREESLGFKNIQWESGQPGESCTHIQIRNTYIIINKKWRGFANVKTRTRNRKSVDLQALSWDNEKIWYSGCRRQSHKPVASVVEGQSFGIFACVAGTGVVLFFQT